MSLLSSAVISPENWRDFETLFEKHGGVWGGCWCTFHLLSSSEFNRMEKQHRKALHLSAIVAGTTSGVLLYKDDVAVGWCQFGPAQSYEQINRTKAYKALAAERSEIGDWQLPDWRITCLFIDKHTRRQGLREPLLQAALEAIRQQGGGVVEAFPLEIEGNALPQYSGSMALYGRNGFELIGPVGKSKRLMRCTIGG